MKEPELVEKLKNILETLRAGMFQAAREKVSDWIDELEDNQTVFSLKLGCIGFTLQVEEPESKTGVNIPDELEKMLRIVEEGAFHTTNPKPKDFVDFLWSEFGFMSTILVMGGPVTCRFPGRNINEKEQMGSMLKGLVVDGKIAPVTRGGYERLKATGMMFELFPSFTGEYEKDILGKDKS